MKRSLSLLIGCIIALAATAQEQQASVRILTFEEAIQIALKNNIILNTARNNMELAQAQKISGIASLGPNINASGSGSQFNGNSFNPNLGRAVNGIRDNYSASISANMLIFNGFSSISYMRASNELFDAATYFVQRTTQDIMNTVATQYLAVLVDIELLEISLQNWEAQKKLLEQITEQVNLGAKSEVDRYNQDALTKQAEYNAVLAQVTLDNDRALLAQTLVIDAVTNPFEVEKPTWNPAAMIDRSLDVDSLVEQAKIHRADYLRAQKLEEGYRHQAWGSMGNSLPSLVAIFNTGSSYNFVHGVHEFNEDGSPNQNYPQQPFKDQFKTNNFYKQYGLSLNIPIFNGLRNRTAYVQNKITYRNNKLLHQGLNTQIRNDILRAVRTYQGSLKAYVVSVDKLTAAETANRYETERFNLGVTSFVDYTNANRVLVQAQTDKAQAEYRLVFQKILIDYAVGTLRPEDVIGQ